MRQLFEQPELVSRLHQIAQRAERRRFEQRPGERHADRRPIAHHLDRAGEAAKATSDPRCESVALNQRPAAAASPADVPEVA